MYDVGGWQCYRRERNEKRNYRYLAVDEMIGCHISGTRGRMEVIFIADSWFIVHWWTLIGAKALERFDVSSDNPRIFNLNMSGDIVRIFLFIFTSCIAHDDGGAR